jgi:hypothetical protein
MGHHTSREETKSFFVSITLNFIFPASIHLRKRQCAKIETHTSIEWILGQKQGLQNVKIKRLRST